MNNVHDFYRELGKIPPVPDDLFEGIKKRITHRAACKRSFAIIAASLLLSLGLFGVISRQKSNNVVLQPELTAELQGIRDYLNGGDIEAILTLYTGSNDQ